MIKHIPFHGKLTEILPKRPHCVEGVCALLLVTRVGMYLEIDYRTDDSEPPPKI
jgi:hypothetical protein